MNAVQREKLQDLLEDAENGLDWLARLAIQELYTHWGAIDEKIDWCEKRINAHIADDLQAQSAKQLIGVGALTASAAVATVVDFKQFKNGAQFGAWLVLTPKQSSSGGKTKLGRITKRGDTYLRTLLIQGAKAAVMSAHKRQDSISKWLFQLKENIVYLIASQSLTNFDHMKK